MPSFTPIYDRTKVMPGQAQIYLAPYVAASPAVLPADTAALGGAWPSTPQVWTPIGATFDGVVMAFRRNVQNQMIEEQMTPVGVETTDAELRFEVTLAEDILGALRIAFGGGTVTTTAAVSGFIGKKTLALSTDLDHFSLG